MPGVIRPDRDAGRSKALGDPSIGTLCHDRCSWSGVTIGSRASAIRPFHRLGYSEMTQGSIGLLKQPDSGDWEWFTCLNSLRDVKRPWT